MSEKKYFEKCTNCTKKARASFVVYGIFPVARYICEHCGAQFARMLTLSEAENIEENIEKEEK
jgi:transposase-like protein